MILMEILEHSIQYFYHIDIPQLKYGWIAFMLIYGFKFHIFCCILPFLYTTYKCVGHKRICKHKHCGK